MIGLRRVKLTPMMANFMMVVSFDNSLMSDVVYCQFQSENTLQEICNYITEHAMATGFALLLCYSSSTTLKQVHSVAQVQVKSSCHHTSLFIAGDVRRKLVNGRELAAKDFLARTKSSGIIDA